MHNAEELPHSAQIGDGTWADTDCGYGYGCDCAVSGAVAIGIVNVALREIPVIHTNTHSTDNARN